MGTDVSQLKPKAVFFSNMQMSALKPEFLCLHFDGVSIPSYDAKWAGDLFWH